MKKVWQRRTPGSWVLKDEEEFAREGMEGSGTKYIVVKEPSILWKPKKGHVAEVQGS